MELTVDVDGVDRSVSGLTEATTCAQVIYALAHATSQKGRFVLVERFRNAERRLSPNDRPLEMLAKWREHAKNVSFILRKVEDPEVTNNNNNTTTDSASTSSSDPKIENTPPFAQQRIPSTSSVQSAAVYSTIQRKKPEMSAAGASSASLPAYSVGHNNMGTLRNRPPPPDYATVMERRFNTLTRDNKSRPALDPSRFGVTGDGSIASMNLSSSDLAALIEKQRTTIETQLERLYELEMKMSREEERELLQLEKQLENLRMVLEPMRDANWAQQYNQEYTSALRLKMTIESTKDAIQKAKREIDEKSREEEEMHKQIFEMMSLDDNTSVGMPQANQAIQMQAC